MEKFSLYDVHVHMINSINDKNDTLLIYKKFE